MDAETAAAFCKAIKEAVAAKDIEKFFTEEMVKSIAGAVEKS